MPIPTTQTELSNLFAELGAPSPEMWASSQLQEGIPQLHRFLFLKQAWENVLAEDDHTWIPREINYSADNPDGRYAGVGQALARCREKGVADEDLTHIARFLQAHMIFHLGYLIDDPGYLPESVKDVSWGLFPLDENGQPNGESIGGLHESVFELDPAGREMRPKA